MRAQVDLFHPREVSFFAWHDRERWHKREAFLWCWHTEGVYGLGPRLGPEKEFARAWVRELGDELCEPIDVAEPEVAPEARINEVKPCTPERHDVAKR